MRNSTTYSKQARKQVKTLLVDAFGSRCCYCGEIFPIEVFEFHHMVGETKSFDIAQGISKHVSWEKLIKEVEKCVMLCANCHRMLHHGHLSSSNMLYYTKPIFLQRGLNKRCKKCNKFIFDNRTFCSRGCLHTYLKKHDMSAEILLNLYEECNESHIKLSKLLGVSANTAKKYFLKAEKEKLCPVCGKNKHIALKHCSVECAGMAQRRVDWESTDVLLILESTNFNFVQAGKLLGVSDNTVRKRYKKIINGRVA